MNLAQKIKELESEISHLSKEVDELRAIIAGIQIKRFKFWRR